ncbi:hypothetical protein K2173_009112 [Erythroxylum novogranatense]|uniref:Uncharacterized protein n=1 Tax=Erythroxylum novogranatense TaxID=1862640 RepID=A0AAV8TCX4_9ROSI|nr:hypothetical protein K2173_009112 [Erythroxylum novogranatense]
MGPINELRAHFIKILCAFIYTFKTLGRHERRLHNRATLHVLRKRCNHDRGRGLEMKDDGERSRRGNRGGGSGQGGSGKDEIDALGRLLIRIFVGSIKVPDLLKLTLKTFANVSLRAHTASADNSEVSSLLTCPQRLLTRESHSLLYLFTFLITYLSIHIHIIILIFVSKVLIFIYTMRDYFKKNKVIEIYVDTNPIFYI